MAANQRFSKATSNISGLADEEEEDILLPEYVLKSIWCNNHHRINSRKVENDIKTCNSCGDSIPVGATRWLCAHDACNYYVCESCFQTASWEEEHALKESWATVASEKIELKVFASGVYESKLVTFDRRPLNEQVKEILALFNIDHYANSVEFVVTRMLTTAEQDCLHQCGLGDDHDLEEMCIFTDAEYLLRLPKRTVVKILKTHEIGKEHVEKLMHCPHEEKLLRLHRLRDAISGAEHISDQVIFNDGISA